MAARTKYTYNTQEHALDKQSNSQYAQNLRDIATGKRAAPASLLPIIEQAEADQRKQWAAKRAQGRPANKPARKTKIGLQPDYARQKYRKRAIAWEEDRQKQLEKLRKMHELHMANKPGSQTYQDAKRRFEGGYSAEREKAYNEYVRHLYAARKKPQGKLKTT